MNQAEILDALAGLTLFSDLDRPFETHRFDGDKLALERVAVPSPEGREMVSVGRPIPGFDVRIRNEDWEDVPDLAHIGFPIIEPPARTSSSPFLMSASRAWPVTIRIGMRDQAGFLRSSWISRIPDLPGMTKSVEMRSGIISPIRSRIAGRCILGTTASCT